MSRDTRNCKVCGQFMEKRNSFKYNSTKWVCPDCGIVEIEDRSNTNPKWERLSKG